MSSIIALSHPKPRIMRSVGRVLILFLCLAVVRTAVGAEVLPHRALYELSMLKNRDASLMALDGTMAFEWQDSCDGWSINQRSIMGFYYEGGESTDLNWSMVSWEAKDGLSYRFIVRQTTDGQHTDEFRGDATLRADGSGGEATYSAPDRHKVELPAGSFFPTAHSLKVVERAMESDPMLWAQVFDGSDAEGLFSVNVVVTPLTPEARKQADEQPALKGVPGWHISTAFYALEGQAAEPEHEQQLDLFANGVVERMVLDYGDFTVLGTLKRLEALPKPRC